MTIDWEKYKLSEETSIADGLLIIHEKLSLQTSAVGAGELFIMSSHHANGERLKCISKNSQIYVHKHHYRVISNLLLTKYKMMLIKINADQRSLTKVSLNISLMDDYLFHLCSLMGQSICSDIYQVHQHLAQRIVASNKITHHSHIKLIFSQLALNVNHIMELLRSDHYLAGGKNKAYFKVFELVRESMLLLCKIYGGRSFLSDSLLEKILLFDYFRCLFYTGH